MPRRSSGPDSSVSVHWNTVNEFVQHTRQRCRQQQGVTWKTTARLEGVGGWGGIEIELQEAPAVDEVQEDLLPYS